MYIKDTILKSLAMANMDPVIIMDQAPLTHPSYATFSEAMVKEKKSTAEAEALWKLLIDGFRHQRELNKDAQKEAEAIKNTAQFNTADKVCNSGAVEINLSGQLYLLF